MQSQSNRITAAAALIAVGLILGYIESFIVWPINIPGLRIGIANIPVVLAMYLLGPVIGFGIMIGRVVLAFSLFGGGVSFLYSICGAVISYAVMVIVSKTGFSMYGVSICGAVSHNITQALVAAFLIGNAYVLSYIPVLMLIGAFAGLLVGYVSDIMYRRLRKNSFFYEEDI